MDNEKLETIATYATHWKTLDSMLTFEMGEVPHVLAFELCKDRVKMYTSDYNQLFPFRVVEEPVPVIQTPELPNYVVTKKPRSNK